MSELPPDLPRLRTLETWLRLQLTAVRARIQFLEQQERDRPAPVRPPRPDWLLETERLGGRNGRPVRVHVGGCGQARGRAISREQAVDALGQGVEACYGCRPDTELGILG
ncbi:DUF6233 domain-containing protein [Streptomyces rimosus]|uniref:DUF6233 domain-containing protein n=1 Tax=Streptomyces rimosus TaxID=1927 RepID=UPI0004CC7FF0|nr:DUF6233 domain-containing protein [Streptomyces rimosus]